MSARTLPRLPKRGNSAGVEWAPDATAAAEFPDHLIPVTHPNHDAVCIECNYWITIGPDGVEYGHARLANGAFHRSNGDRADCPHRPTESVDPRRAH